LAYAALRCAACSHVFVLSLPQLVVRRADYGLVPAGSPPTNNSPQARCALIFTAARLRPSSIRKGFAGLRPGSDYDSLADAARGRSQADWLVGMNLSRAYALDYDEKFSVGRVQTPTLATTLFVARSFKWLMPSSSEPLSTLRRRSAMVHSF
jgi:hypothetical protein